MPAQFSFGLALEIDASLQEQFQRLRLARSELMEIRFHARETVARSRELMAFIDRQLALRM